MLNNSVARFAYSLFYSYLNDEDGDEEEGPHEEENVLNECTWRFLWAITLYSPIHEETNFGH